ncbi:MAG: SOS response-associated peptidase family protein [Gammaproteobacteria bacterium]|nr:SOS response-associated peptidase family protein [Gammaproteobacteria bacterium]MCY4357399.1 SOS response-associated peptidase family protein [Gammaproteobacteria bacterium]
MCTNFALVKQDGSVRLAERLGVDAAALIYSHDFRPGATISIVRETNGSRLVNPAIWWLYLRQTPDGLKPHREYFSVNTNHAKLSGKTEYRRSRCLIPVSAFVESQEGKNPHLLKPRDGSVMAFGGLCKEWTDKCTGECVLSASIITLPGHPALENIHRKSTPLWLPEEMYDVWLSPQQQETQIFEELLTPALRTTLLVTPIDRAGSKQPVGETYVVAAANH